MVRKARFSGIARVGLTLSLLAVSLASPLCATPVAAHEPSFRAEDCKTWNVGIDLFSKRVYGEPGSWQSLQCDYRPDDVASPSASVQIGYFTDKDEAATTYAERQAVHAGSIARIGGGVLETIDGADRIAYLATGKELNTGQHMWWSHGALVRYERYFAEWETSTFAGEDEGRRLYEHAVEQTVALIDWIAQQSTLKVHHYHPFMDEFPSGYSGGDLVASIWRGGEPLREAGVKVYFFRDMLATHTCDQGILTFPNQSEWFGYEHEFLQLSNDYLKAITDRNGVARANYLGGCSFGCIDYQKLSEELASKGECRIPITAVVFDNPEAPEPSIVLSEDIELVFKGVARIVKVGTNDERLKPAGQVIVERKGVGTSVTTSDHLKTYDTATQTRGYNLYDGDTIILSPLDNVDIQWLAGSYMKLMPNVAYMEKNNWSHAQVKLGAKDLGWGSYLDSWIGYAPFQFAVGTTGLLAGIYSIKLGSTALSAAGVVLGLPALVLGGWNVTRSYFSPILLQHQSEILVEFTDDGPVLYTAEGTATLYDPSDGRRVDVVAGKKIHLAPEGSPSSAESFQEADLNPGLTALLDAVREEVGSGAPAEDEPTSSAFDDQSSMAQTGGDSESGLADYAGYCCLPALTGIALLAIVLIRRRRKRRQTLSQVSEVSEPDETTGVVIASSAAITDLPPAPLPAETTTGQTQYCQQCGMPVVAGAAFCGQCGAPIAPPPAPMTRYCPNCGVMYEPGQRFCINCGARLPADPASI